MDVDSVRSFLRVAAEGSYVRAAPYLHLSVSALSRRMQELERELGVELFERTSRGVRLSSSGKDLLDRAQALVDAADALLADATSRRGPVGLRLGISPGLEPTLRGRVVGTLAERGIHSVTLVPDQNIQLIRKLLNGHLDIALSHERPQSRRLSARLIYRQTTQIFIGEGHPLASKDPLHLGDLVHTPFVTSPRMLASAPVFYARLRSLLGEAGVDETVEVDDRLWIAELVANGTGFGLWVSREARTDGAHEGPEGVVVRRVEGLELLLPTYLVHRSGAPWLTDELRAALEDCLPSLDDSPELMVT